MICKRPSLQFLIVLLTVPVAMAQAVPFEDLRASVRAFDDAASRAALDALTETAASNPDAYRAQWEAAEACRLLAAQRRDAANLAGTSGRTRKDLTKAQLALAKRGTPYAERALELAADDPARSAAHRVLGELAAMEISGMISGIRKGPVAESNIERALALAPDDPENLRASGVMYRYRPAFVGGDVAKAVAVLADCHERDPASQSCLFLLAVAQQRNGNEAQAREHARELLELNPAHKNARALLDGLGAAL